MAELELRTASDTGQGYDVVLVRGDLDLRSHDQLRGLTGSSDLTAPLLVLDLTELGFLDSAGIGAIALARRQAEERGAELTLVAASPHVTKVLQVTGLDQTLRVCPSVDDVQAP
ncbi:STAS domain-containing protein [Nocardioides flavescens]|uniref:Anti-sigma factor antagonist n=1 Tax=Nocardioides flavescens TaxID=2691959 RepID=A0A6L7EU49_9ACTN|nr:STAS domain-containing protein [Nocardioides flavescens]MXG90883.1 anti-sigma factor antagonist [Nocardioides flavescens]